MPLEATPLEGLFLFQPQIWHDDRGYFYESFRADMYTQAGITQPFVQDNQAFSTRGALRGLHFQTGEMAQAKLVRVIQGEVLDVVVDIRPGSKTYGAHYKVVLSGENHLQMYVPRGFAHGYLVLSDTAIFCYKCDNYYSKAHEGGVRYDDPNLNIDWGMPQEMLKISAKDLILPTINDL